LQQSQVVDRIEDHILPVVGTGVPTAMELGVGIVAWSSNIWIAPRGIPATFRENLTAALRTAMDDPVVRSQMRELGIVPEFVAPTPLPRWRPRRETGRSSLRTTSGRFAG
ncbi:MAG: hypothetical protein O3B08_17260, partial [Proteobacteria bacterium]|nr:hypothetical protein [Pseudomonadota bacterium]